MKKLYTILLILIVVYIGINFQYNGLNLLPGLADAEFSDLILGGNDSNTTSIGDSIIKENENYTYYKITNTSINVVNSNGLTISVAEINKDQNLSDTVNNLLNGDGGYTSNQTISQNDVTVYFVYQESAESYNANIYFNKNNHNYLITGKNISYDDSTNFINSCKDIINSISESKGIDYKRW